MRPKLIIILSLALCTQCQTPDTDRSPDPSILLETDRDFSALSAARGMNFAFTSYIADDGVILRNNSYPIVGKNLVVARLNERSDTTFRLTWEPMYGYLAASKDLGYTYGTYLVSAPAGDSLGVGTYVSIWKKQQDGQWKFVFDAGNEGLSSKTF